MADFANHYPNACSLAQRKRPTKYATDDFSSWDCLMHLYQNLDGNRVSSSITEARDSGVATQHMVSMPN